MSDIHKIISDTVFYGILDAGYVSSDDWEDKFLALATGGATMIQVRAKDKSQKEKRTLIDRTLEARLALPREDRPILILNNDLELCLQYENLGLHIRPTDSPLADIRAKLGSNRVLGISAHSPEEVRSISEIDPGILNYFSIGPIFDSPTKPGSSPKGLRYIRWVSDLEPELPFFCVGGINRQNARQVAEARGRRIVSVSDILLAEDTAEAVREMINLVNFKR